MIVALGLWAAYLCPRSFPGQNLLFSDTLEQTSIGGNLSLSPLLREAESQTQQGVGLLVANSSRLHFTFTESHKPTNIVSKWGARSIQVTLTGNT